MKKIALAKLLCIILMSFLIASLVSCGCNNDFSTKDTVTLTFDLCGGKMDEPKTVEYEKGDVVESLPQPSREGVLFAGWHIGPVSEGGAIEIEAPFEIHRSITLYAWWQDDVAETDTDTESLETETDSGADIETDTATNTVTDTELDTETETSTETETDTEGDTETESSTETESDTKSETEVESETTTDSQTETETVVDSETECDTETTDTENVTETETDESSETDTAVGTDTDVPSATDTETVTDTETETTTDTEVDTETDTEVDSTTDTETEVECDTDTETETETDVETDTATDTVTDTEIETETDVNTDTELDTDTDVETDVPAHTHTEETIPAVEPTCEETGLTEGKKCSICGEILVEQEEIPQKAHDYSYKTIVKEPSCTAMGFTTHVCVCGDSFVDTYIDKIAHTFGEWETTKEADCLTEGERKHTCECGEYELEQIPAKGHEGQTIVKEATCIDDGYKKHTCDTCGNVYVSDYVYANGHSFGDWTVAYEPTCVEDGRLIRECSECSEVQEQISSKLGHHYENSGIQSAGNSEYTVYTCARCQNTYETNLGSEELSNESIQKINVPTDFSFNVLSDGDEAHVRESIKIYYAMFAGSEHLDKDEVYIDFELESLGEGVWRVYNDGGFGYSQSYVAELDSDVKFEEQRAASKMTFSTEKDENHENKLQYNDEIVFLKQLELESGGYYPYYIQDTEGSESLYLMIPKVDSLSEGQIICIGDITSFDDLEDENLDECYIGKITEINKLNNLSYIVRLEVPELTEVFEELDVTYDEYLNFDEAELLDESLSDDVVATLYNDKEFLQFVNQVNLAAKSYLSDGGYDTSVVNTASFLDKIQITPKVKMQGSSLVFELNGSINIPIKTKAGEELGSIDVSFFIGATSTYRIGLTYRLVGWFVFPTDLTEFDLSFEQNTTLTFTFDVKIDMEYSVSEMYALNTKSNLLHERDCLHVKRIKNDTQIKYVSFEEASKLTSEKKCIECTICKPIEGLRRDTVVINESENTFHAFNCYYVSLMNESNKKFSKQNAGYWISLGYKPCSYCKPQQESSADFAKKMEESLEYSDWTQNLNEIGDAAKNTEISKENKKQIKIARVTFPIVAGINVNIDVNFTLDFKLEASLAYKFSYEQTNQFGIRLENNSLVPYSSTESGVKEHSIELMGKAELRAGFNVDATVGLAFLEKWASAGISGGIGCYARISGVYVDKDLAAEGADYAAAYFELGIYIDVSAHYALIFWDGSATIFEKEYPILALGYEKAYYAYEKYEDTLVIVHSYDIASNDLLKASYFDLKTLTSKVDELNLNETDKYQIIITFEDGRYCKLLDGKIVATDDAPCYFKDKMTIKVVGKRDWDSFKTGSAIFYLADYVIDLEFYSDGEHEAVLTSSKAPTCEEMGYNTYTCSCGETYTEYLQPIGHNYTTYASCENGTHKRVCVNDDTHVDTRGCVYDEIIEKPTCLEPGHKTYVCNVCLYSYDGGEIDALGHTFFSDKCIRCDEQKISEGLEYIFDEETDSYIVTGIGNCKDTEIIIPSTHNGKDVTGIANGAFQGNTTIEKIVFSDKISTIGSVAFQGCASLEEIVLSDKVTSIGEGAFSGCSDNVTIQCESTSKPDGWSENWTEDTGGIIWGVCIHKRNETIFGKDATCTENGLTNGRKCSDCGKVWVEQSEILATGHAEQALEGRAPTCTEKGLTEGVRCTKCSETLVAQRVLQKLPHSMITVEAQEPTCEEYGFNTHAACEYCAYSFDRNYVLPPKGHRYSDSEICLDCGYIATVIESTGLEYEYDEESDSYWVSGVGSCTDKHVVIPSHHNGKPVTGVKDYAFRGNLNIISFRFPDTMIRFGTGAFSGCSFLEHVSIPISVKEIGENAFLGCNNAEIDCEAKERPDGWSIYWSGTIIGGEIEDPDGDGSGSGSEEKFGPDVNWDTCIHTRQKLVLGIAPTCEKVGYTNGRSCYDCGKVWIKREVIPMLDHSYEMCDAQAPSCEEIGWEAYEKCTVCGYSTMKKLPALGHTPEIIQGKLPTCLENGIADGQKCSVCDKILAVQAVIDAKGHTPTLLPTVAPTCTDTGLTKGEKCSECGEILLEQEVIDALGHDYENNVCTLCGLERVSDGLEFTLGENGQAYIVTDIGTCTDTDVIIPHTYEGLPVTSIGEGAFYDCNSLTSVVIPNSVTSIGHSAFGSCDSIENVTIPDSVTSIGYGTFEFCDSLVSVTIPDSVKSIEMFAFAYCNSLESVTIPDSVTQIDDLAFSANRSLVSITVDEKNPLYKSIDGSLYTKNGTALIQYAIGKADTSFTIPNGVKMIGNSAFEWCDSLESITIPDSVTTIGSNAFSSCDSLTSVTMEFGLISIGDGAFSCCYALQTVTIPDSVTFVGGFAFSSCDSLTIYCKATEQPSGWSSDWNYSNCPVVWGYCQHENTEIIPAADASCTDTGLTEGEKCSDCGSVLVEQMEIPSYGGHQYIDSYVCENCGLTTAESKGLAYTSVIYDNEYGYEITGIGTCDDTDIVIPWTIDGDPVISIGDSAFANNDAITSVTLPNCIKNIGKDAFKNISLDACNEYDNAYYLGSIDNPYFVLLKAKDAQITSCDIHEETRFIHSYAFCNCESIEEIIIPDKVIGIGRNAFEMCTNATSLTIGEGVRRIGDEAFADLNILSELYFNAESAEDLDEEWNCVFAIAGQEGDGITVRFGDKVKRIPAYLFCPGISIYPSIKEIYIPANVEEIGACAIGSNIDCTVYCEASEKPESWNNIDAVWGACMHRNTVVLEAEEATEEKNGLTEGLKCSGCGEVLVKQLSVDVDGNIQLETDSGEALIPSDEPTDPPTTDIEVDPGKLLG